MINSFTKVNIKCYIHGIFEQIPNSHLQGHGCKKCFIIRQSSSLDEFLIQAQIIHYNFYNYDKVIYINNKSKIEIVCPKHGSFFQIPDSHLHNNGCLKCSNLISQSEIDWLKSLNIVNLQKQIPIKIGDDVYHVDGFDPITNTVYEFYGDYWHGNPSVFDGIKINQSNGKTFGELYKKTIDREQQIKNAGYNFISIWELDYKKGSV